MGNVIICCTEIITGEAIKGKDEILSGNNKIEENSKLNNQNNINNANNHNLSSGDSKTNNINKVQQPSGEIEIKINNINNNIYSISSTYNCKPNENSSQCSHKVNNNQQTAIKSSEQNNKNSNLNSKNNNNDNRNEINIEFEEKKSEEESEKSDLSKESKESKKSKESKESLQINLPEGDKYEGETKNGKYNGEKKLSLKKMVIDELGISSFINNDFIPNHEMYYTDKELIIIVNITVTPQKNLTPPQII